MRTYMTILRAITRKIHNFTDETDLDGAGDGTEITSGFEEDETDTEDDEYGYDEPEEEE